MHRILRKRMLRQELILKSHKPRPNAHDTRNSVDYELVFKSVIGNLTRTLKDEAFIDKQRRTP